MSFEGVVFEIENGDGVYLLGDLELHMGVQLIAIAWNEDPSRDTTRGMPSEDFVPKPELCDNIWHCKIGIATSSPFPFSRYGARKCVLFTENLVKRGDVYSHPSKRCMA